MHEGERIALPQLMTHYGSKHAVLLFVFQSTQRMTKRRPDPSPAEFVLRTARKLATQHKASLDPLGLMPQQPSNGTRTELLLVAQRADHPRLVERCAGARWSIGSEQPLLVLRARRRWPHQHRHHAVALLPPTRQPLETVEYLVVPVCAHGNQQRKLRTNLLAAGGNASA